ncbi:uncharacterized protein LOC116805263, partial [Drosophila grimshawi]
MKALRFDANFSQRLKAMEDCEFIGIILEMIGDVLFGSTTNNDDDY